MRNKLSRVLAMILAATMTVNMLPISVFATAPESPSQNPPVEDEFNDQEADELDDDEVVHPEGTIENEDGTYTWPDGTIHDAEGNLIRFYGVPEDDYSGYTEEIWQYKPLSEVLYSGQ